MLLYFIVLHGQLHCRSSLSDIIIIINNPEQVVHTHVLLSPSSIIWYRHNCLEGNGSMWERCGLPPI